MRFPRHIAITLAALGLTYSSFANNPLVQKDVYGDLVRGEQALKAGRWSESAAYAELVLMPKPIRVSVDDSTLPFGGRAQARQALAEAAALWEEATHGRIHIEVADDAHAPVKLRFQPQVFFGGLDAAGRAVWTRSVQDWGFGQYMSQISGEIQVRTLAPNGHAMSFAAMRHTIAHELGHMIGLWDSPKVGDIMGPVSLSSPAETPSDRECDALDEVLGSAEAIWRQALLAQETEQR